ncbi:hypothetical protein OKW30_003713 [Paraburkholderia sp. Clong3]|uniref:hypothetical protein n=1 Tax=Paraburkholderia sp. Clong3 TaxID=2991061 RepID=UPI003D1C8AF9
MPSAKSFAQRLDEYPALFGIWLAEQVMLGLGQDGHFSLYPHIQRAIGGVDELTNPDRDLLWRAFRRAMLKLGIQPLPRLSGRRHMADEYVRQAGVPIAFADDLAGKMIQLAKRIGVADEDDQEGLVTWQSALLNKLQPPFSVTVRKAVERDAQAYYTRAFLRVYGNAGVATSHDTLELALAKAFTQEGTSSNIKRAAIPQLLYRDGVLGVLFPPVSTATSYQVICGDLSNHVRTDEQGGFRPLPKGLHSDVTVQRSDGERLLSAKLWPDKAANRLLIFNADGRLRASAQLGQEDPVELAPGQYLALCRFAPTNTDDWEEVCEQPRLVEVSLDVRPGVETALVNGPAQVLIAGHNLPSFRLGGAFKESLEHIEFQYGKLTVTVEVPADWRQAGQQVYELRVACGAARQGVPVVLDGEGRSCVELGDVVRLLKLPPGMRRLVIELARAGDARTLQRQSVLYWVGLTGISYGLKFSYERRPENLIAASLIGLKFADQVAEPIHDHGRMIRLAFDVGAGRLVHLSWHRPGLFVEVEIPGKDGTTSVLPRPLGATETVSLTSAKNIIVSGSEPGYVTLGSMRTFIDFAQRPTKVFPGSFLASRLEPGARTLTFETMAGGASVPILELSQPHVVTSITTSRLGNVFIVRISVSGEPTDVAVTGKELSSGREARAEHELLAGAWHDNDLARMQVYGVSVGNSHDLYILVDVATLPSGVWTLGFGARISGVWGRLEDAGEGRIAIAFARDNTGHEIPGTQVVADTEYLELREVAARLMRLNGHFRQFWSPVCWNQQSWLGLYFAALVVRLVGHEAEFITELADMAMACSADDVRQGFIPKQSVPALLNKTFAQPRTAYKRVNIKPHPLSVALRAMPELDGPVETLFGETLHQTAAMAFKNVALVMHGRRPKGFDLAAYRDAISQTRIEAGFQLDDEFFLPRGGDLLGPLHLAHAWRDLERGYASSLLMPSKRKACAIALARLLHQRHPAFDHSVPLGLRGKGLVLDARKLNTDAMSEVEQQEQENLGYIANACAWFAWHCRMEARGHGALANFHSSLASLRKRIELEGPAASDCLAYFLHVAPSMFAYYLLLWELVLTVEFGEVADNVRN